MHRIVPATNANRGSGEMTIRKACVIGFFCLAPLAGAGAQTITIQRPGSARSQRWPHSRPDQRELLRAGPANDSEQSTALRDRASRAIYDLAAHECEVLREKLADDCRLENVNVNITVNRPPQQLGGQPTEGFQVAGTLGYRISQKLSPSTP